MSGSEHDADRKLRQREEIFGDVLPDTTTDEAADESDGNAGGSADEWLKRQVPPHHG